MKMTVFFSLVLVLVATPPSFALISEYAEITGNPTVKVETWPDYTKRTELSQEESVEYALHIGKVFNKHVWMSRENRNLKHSHSGMYDSFVNESGAGYIKIVHSSEVCDYMEHVHQHFGTITYYGKCQVRI